MELSDKHARLVAGGFVSILGVFLLSIPLYDIWDDVTNAAWDIPTTILENILPIGLALVLIYGGVHLARLDWDGQHVFAVTKWTAVGAIGSTVLFLWIISIQLWEAGLKPYIIALNGILLGTVVSFGVGTYSASRDRTHQHLQRQYDRMSALFGNTSDYIASTRVTPEGLALEEINDSLADAGVDPEPLLTDIVTSEETIDGYQDVLWHAQADQILETKYDREGREFFVRIVPFDVADDSAEVFFVLTDITDQTQLAREVAARERIEYLHTVASEMAGTDRATDAYDLTIDAIEQTLSVDAIVLRIDGAVVRSRGADGPLDPDAVDRVVGAAASVVGGGQSIHTRSEGRSVVTVRIGDHGVLQVAGGSIDDSQHTVIELLATHLREALTRIQRRDELEAERERMAFVARIVRHDLLDGMNVLLTQLELLDRHVSADGTDRLETVRERVDDMVEQLETMRTFMQAVENDADYQRRPTSLTETIYEEVEQARQADRSMTVDVDVPDVEVLADELLADVFRNLLSNARRHTDAERPHVRIDGETRDDTVEIRVGDDGPGIPEDRREAVFDRGKRGRESAGTGIGLYLVEQLVHNYGGTITVGESDLGGAEFRLTLPLAEE